MILGCLKPVVALINNEGNATSKKMLEVELFKAIGGGGCGWT